MNSAQIWHRKTKLKEKKSASKCVAQTLILFIIFHKQEKLDSDFGRYLAKHLLRFRLPWQKLRSQVTKRYTKLCAIG